MKKILLFFLILNTGIAFSQTRLKIDSLSAFSLPGKPTIKKNDTNYVYFLKKYSVEYIILVQNFKNRKGFKLRKDSLSSFYQGVVEGNINALRNSTLLLKKEVIVDGFKAIDFEYKVDSTALPNVRFQRSILLNKRMITYCFWTFSDSLQINLSKKDAFFKSVAITADKEKTKQYTDEGLAYDLGVIAGKYLALPLIVIVGLLIVFLVRRVAYKKITG